MQETLVTEIQSEDWVHGGDLIAAQLKEEKISYIFTLTGGHISGIYDGARFQKIKLIDFRHEQAAVHAADAYARLTLTPGVAALTAGPGVTNSLTGIANAYYANSPILVLGGRNPYALGSSGNLQDAPQTELTTPITKYTGAIHDIWRIPHVIREALSSCMSGRYGPAYIDVPIDIQLTRISKSDTPSKRRSQKNHQPQPTPDVIETVVTCIQTSKKPLVLVGSGTYWGEASDSLAMFVEKFRLPVYLNGMARGLLGKNNPYQLFAGRGKAMAEADLVILLGIDLDFRMGYGQPGTLHEQATVIQIDPDGSMIGKHCDVTTGIVSGIDNFLKSMVSQKIDFRREEHPFSTFRLSGEKKFSELEKAKKYPSKPIHPERFVFEVIHYLPPDTLVIGDGGDIVALFAEYYKPDSAGGWLDPGPFGCIGIGVPFAMGARLAKPDIPIAVISGDGAFGFNALEIDSAVRQNLPFVLIIGNDGAWGEMRTFHEDIFGPFDRSAQYLSQETKYEDLTNALGGFGQRVEDADDLVPALKRAFDSGLPSVINVILDPTYRRKANTISGKHVAVAYGDGDAFIRNA